MDILAKFPKQIAAGSKPGANRYSIIPDRYAIHGLPPGSPAPDASYRLNEGTIAVIEGFPNQSALADSPGKLSPVYALMPGGSPAVPTGLVFIRFAEGIAVDERRAQIENAGYEVAEPLAYAPNAAWLRARSGNIADALTGLASLQTIPTVESVEPQMLMESARR